MTCGVCASRPRGDVRPRAWDFHMVTIRCPLSNVVRYHASSAFKRCPFTYNPPTTLPPFSSGSHSPSPSQEYPLPRHQVYLPFSLWGIFAMFLAKTVCPSVSVLPCSSSSSIVLPKHQPLLHSTTTPLAPSKPFRPKQNNTYSDQTIQQPDKTKPSQPYSIHAPLVNPTRPNPTQPSPQANANAMP